jgi:hypothetical protein
LQDCRKGRLLRIAILSSLSFLTFSHSAVLQSANYAIHPVPLSAVTVTGGFWRPKIDVNRAVTIPHILRETRSVDRCRFRRRSPRFDPSLLGGVTVVTGGGLTAVPYYAWNNRGAGQMAVWIRH